MRWVFVTLCCAALCPRAASADESGALKADPQPAGEPKTVTAEQFGVRVEVPAPWTLVELEHEDRAFVLLLDQGDPDRPGVAACEIAVAPSSLEEYHKRIEAQRDRENGPRKLLDNEIHESESRRTLVSQWQFTTLRNGVWDELKVRLIENRHLYTFTLNADAEHFPRLREPFLAMVAKAELTPPKTGLLELPDSYWLQRDLHFGMQLPEGWHPSFRQTKEVQFLATGEAHEVFTDNVLVIAGKPHDLDFEQLIEEFPKEIARADPAAKVLRCEKVRQGESDALETVLETMRGPFRITIFERRFRGKRLSYEVKFTMLSDAYAKQADAVKASADSFKEFPVPESTGVF